MRSVGGEILKNKRKRIQLGYGEEGEMLATQKIRNPVLAVLYNVSVVSTSGHIHSIRPVVGRQSGRVYIPSPSNVFPSTVDNFR